MKAISLNIKDAIAVGTILIGAGIFYNSHVNIAQRVSKIEQSKPALMSYRMEILEGRVLKISQKIDKIYEVVTANIAD